MTYDFRTRWRSVRPLRRSLLGSAALGVLPVALSGCLASALPGAATAVFVRTAHAAAPVAIDDTVVAGAVRRALATEFGPSASTIWVEVYRGAVYLSGGLPTAAERQRVETVAAGVRGVISVQSEFDAKPSETRLAGR